MPVSETSACWTRSSRTTVPSSPARPPWPASAPSAHPLAVGRGVGATRERRLGTPTPRWCKKSGVFEGQFLLNQMVNLSHLVKFSCSLFSFNAKLTSYFLIILRTLQRLLNIPVSYTLCTVQEFGGHCFRSLDFVLWSVGCHPGAVLRTGHTPVTGRAITGRGSGASSQLPSLQLRACGWLACVRVSHPRSSSPRI